MRPGSLALIFQLQHAVSSPPSRPPPRPQDQLDVRGGGYVKRPCLYCKRQTHPTMEEFKLCCQFDSVREVSMLMIKAYALSFLLFVSVLLWTAGDACLYYGYSYLDYRYSRLNHTYAAENAAGFG